MTPSVLMQIGLTVWLAALAAGILWRVMTGEIPTAGMLESGTGRRATLQPERLLTLGAFPIIIGLYALDALNSGPVMIDGHLSMPKVPDGVIEVLTGSNAAYLAGKVARNVGGRRS